ncbi:hypothetical protein V6O07_01370 [Arthrospira platensis SPKY2]
MTGQAQKVGVQGMGGLGKTVLAAALARDNEVRRQQETPELRQHSIKRGGCNIYANMGSHKDHHTDRFREVVMLLKVKKRGNSLSVIVPKEMATNMNIDDGDSLFARRVS